TQTSKCKAPGTDYQCLKPSVEPIVPDRERHFATRATRGSLPSAGMPSFANLENLPGADLVKRGAEDLQIGHESAEALLVSIASPRLQSMGIELPSPIPSPEHKLYLLLAREKGNAAHSAYNALIRRLVSFERAAACVN